MIKSNLNIQPINIFDHDFLYTAYADDTIFFIKNKDSVIELELLNTCDNTCDKRHQLQPKQRKTI